MRLSVRVERILGLLLLVCLAAALVSAGAASAPRDGDAHVAQLILRGPIGPATADYVRRAHSDAVAAGARAVVIQLDTPGGLVDTTRDLVQLYLHSEIPVITWVAPAGARAASAGTYLVYASHVAAMAPSTTLGAATPVSLGAVQVAPASQPDQATPDVPQAAPDTPQSTPDRPRVDPADAAGRKAVNDAVAWIKSLAARHDRNAEWAERAVREAATLTAAEALEQNVVDLVAASASELLAQAHGREVVMETGTQRLEVADLPLRVYEPDWRHRLLSIITNPQIAYLLLLVGIYGLLLEGYNPGALVPGTVGVIALVIALYALQMLPVNYAGLALIVVAAGLMAAEAFAPSFGVLGIGGVVALAIGSLLLMDTDVPGFRLSRGLILAVSVFSGAAMLGLLYLVRDNLRRPRPDIRRQLVGECGVMVNGPGDSLQVLVWGERWQATSASALGAGQRVRVIEQQGLMLVVAPAQDETAGAVAAKN